MAGNGVWQDCQSLPTRTLHQQVYLLLAINLHFHSLHEVILSSVGSPSHIGSCSLSRRDVQGTVHHPHIERHSVFLTHSFPIIFLTHQSGFSFGFVHAASWKSSLKGTISAMYVKQSWFSSTIQACCWFNLRLGCCHFFSLIFGCY